MTRALAHRSSRYIARRRALFAAASVVALAGAPALAERVAVLPVDVERDGAPIAVTAAAELRKALVAQGFDVVDAESVRTAMSTQLRPAGGRDVATYKKQLAQADAAAATLDENGSLKILERLIEDLAIDPDFSTEKQELLEGARMKLASRLFARVGPKETETDFGVRARAMLEDALRANPKLSPSTDEYPPRFLALLASARADVAKQGNGVLSVDSRPQGAKVLLEGRDMGTTPLHLGKDSGPTPGRYRIWVEAAGAHSVPQQITIATDSPASVNVDLAFEGALWSEGPGLRPPPGSPIDDDVGKKLGRFLGVDTLVFVGTGAQPARGGEDAAEWLWGASFVVAEGVTARRGSVDLATRAADARVTNAADALAAFLGKAEHDGIGDRPLPGLVLPEKKNGLVVGSSSSPSLSVSSSRDAPGDFPWVPVAVIGGSVLAAAAVAGGVIAVIALQPQPVSGTLVITARSIDQ